MAIRKIKVSETPRTETRDGLIVLGVDKENKSVHADMDLLRGNTAFQEWLEENPGKTYEDWIALLQEPALEAAEESRQQNELIAAQEEIRQTNEKNRESNEEERKTAEQERISAEEERKAAEENREAAEANRDTAEQQREEAEVERKQAESDRRQSEEQRTAQEEERETAEANRKEAEDKREQNEESRISNEQQRAEAEQNRESAETDRKYAEQERKTAEQERVSAEEQRISAEEERKAAEKNREAAEANRDTAEQQREETEAERKQAESDRRQSEAQRTAQEEERKTAEALREEAEEKRELAEAKRETDTAERLELMDQETEKTRQATTAANQAAQKAEEAADRANTLSDNRDQIIDGIWWRYNEESGAYESTGIAAKGSDFVFLGFYNSLEALLAAVPNPKQGDVYGVGTEPPYQIFIYDAQQGQWIDNGTLQGEKGDKGDKGDPGEAGQMYEAVTLATSPTENTLTYISGDATYSFKVGQQVRFFEPYLQDYLFYQLYDITPENKAKWKCLSTEDLVAKRRGYYFTANNEITEPAHIFTETDQGVIADILSRFRRCMSKTSGEGKVKVAYLNDYERPMYFTDGSYLALYASSQIDVMVHTPEFYYKFEKLDDKRFRYHLSLTQLDETYVKIRESLLGTYVSYVYQDKAYSVLPTIVTATTYDNIVEKCAARGKGYQLMDYEQICMLGLVFLMKYGTRDVQGILGTGYASPNTTPNPGMTDSQNITTSCTNFMGVLGLYDGGNEFVSGVEVENGVWKITNPDGTIRTVKGVQEDGWVKKLQLEEGPYFDLIPLETGGSSSTYYPDYCTCAATESPTIVYRPGGTTANAGIACYNTKNSSTGVNAYGRITFRGEMEEISGTEFIQLVNQ